MLVVRACSISLLPSYLLRNTVNSRLTNTRLLRMLAITDKIQIPGESYRGFTLTGNDSHLYRLDNFIILILDRVDTTYFWYNLIILKLQSVVHHLLKNTSKYFCFPQLLFFVCAIVFASWTLSFLFIACWGYLLFHSQLLWSFAITDSKQYMSLNMSAKQELTVDEQQENVLQ